MNARVCRAVLGGGFLKARARHEQAKDGYLVFALAFIAGFSPVVVLVPDNPMKPLIAL